MAKEFDVYRAVATYLRMQYPTALFHFDLSGITTTKAAAGMNKAIQKGRGFPDLQILVPRGGFHGLFIEIKRNGERITKRDGSFASEHIEAQNEVLEQLAGQHYRAVFAVGFDECKKIIDEYFAQH